MIQISKENENLIQIRPTSKQAVVEDEQYPEQGQNQDRIAPKVDLKQIP
jgi:hypothetical protein